MAVLSEHFNTPWTVEAQQEVGDIDSQEDYLATAFEIGDVVRVKGSTENSWAELVPSLGDEAWFSKETFEIVGLKPEEDLGIDETDSKLRLGLGLKTISGSYKTT